LDNKVFDITEARCKHEGQDMEFHAFWFIPGCFSNNNVCQFTCLCIL